jgi:hypothetical protein
LGKPILSGGTTDPEGSMFTVVMLALGLIPETINGVGTAFDLRHDPGDEKDHEEIESLDEDPHQWRNLLAWLHVFWRRREELVANEVYAEGNSGEDRREDEAPAGADAVFADEELAQG